jgi:hypothetical protein
MSDEKNFRPAAYSDDTPRRGEQAERGTDGDSGREQQGWDAYRKWLKTMNKRPEARRAPVDHSVYSWKGYHSWADRVRQSWKPEKG